MNKIEEKELKNDSVIAYYHLVQEVYRIIKFLDMFIPFSPLEIVCKRNYSIFGLTCQRGYFEFSISISMRPSANAFHKAGGKDGW